MLPKLIIVITCLETHIEKEKLLSVRQITLNQVLIALSRNINFDDRQEPLGPFIYFLPYGTLNPI